jgi:hypothetical protein
MATTMATMIVIGLSQGGTAGENEGRGPHRDDTLERQ